MSLFETCAKLAVYLICIGLALELSHRIYWRTNERVAELSISTFARSALSTLVACIPLATAFTITIAFITLIDKQSLASLGLAYDGDSLTRVAYGAGVALGCVTLVFLLGVLFGLVEVRRSKLSEDCVSCLPLFLGGVMDFFTAAVFEEIIFRGYVFYLLYNAGGVQAAVIGSAVVFSVAHLIKHPSIPAMYVLNAIIFGILAAVCRHYTGSLWLPIGLHFGWNVVSGPIFGLPYSGRTYDRGVVVSEVSGPVWLTGGRYSFDAGVLGTVALIMAAAGLSMVAPLQ